MLQQLLPNYTVMRNEMSAAVAIHISQSKIPNDEAQCPELLLPNGTQGLARFLYDALTAYTSRSSD